MDKELKGRGHISKLYSSLNIGRLRYMMDKDTTALIMQALVLSRLDYCNSLILGCAKYQLYQLQEYKMWHAELWTTPPNITKYPET